MEILDDTFDFDSRPSRSRYAPVVKALVEEGKFGVKLKRGSDFPAGVKIDTVQAGVRTELGKAGKRAKTRILSPDELAVRLHPVQNPAKRSRKREAVAA
jgi:hypothetical protein